MESDVAANLPELYLFCRHVLMRQERREVLSAGRF